MPKMDGIELIGRIRRENIACHFIIVSGYRQFEYAHNALKYDVEDYILKPIDNNELNMVLKKLSFQIIEEEQKDYHELALKQHGEERIKRFFLNRIIGELEEDVDLNSIDREFGLHFVDGIFRMLYIRSDISGDELDFSENIDSMQNKLENVFRQMFEADCEYVLIDKDYGNIRIGIHYTSDKALIIDNNIIEYFSRVRNVADLFKGYHITMGVGGEYTHIHQWKISGQEAYYAIGSRLVRGTDRIIYWEDEKKNQPQMIISLDEEREILNQLHKSYEILDTKSFNDTVKRLFMKIRINFSSPEMFRLVERISDSFLEEKHAKKNMIYLISIMRRTY